MRYMFRKPRNTFQVVQGVVSMLAGDVYSNRAVRRRLLLFKTLYSVACLFSWRSVRTAWEARRPKNQPELRESSLSSE